MPQIKRTAVLALLAALLLGAPGFAQTVVGGVSPGGAFYTIVAPDQWNGGLVIWNHGFSTSPPGPVTDLGPLQLLQLAEGYAVAASSYQQAGWAVFDTNEDLEGMYDAFVSNFGEPSHVLLFGASLGGIVTARAIEQAEIGNVVGALPICGAMAGSRNFDGGLDLRLIYDAICKTVPGANIPGAAKGLPLGSTLSQTDVVLALNACFGHDLPPGARTPQQQNRLNRFLAVSQIPQSFINTTLGFFATFGMADLVHNPEKLGGRIGTGNRNVDYGDPGINNGIQRVGASKGQRMLLRDNYTPTGDVGNTKIISIHTDKDGLVIVENQSEYASVVPPGNLTTAIVQEAVPSHCGFTPAETTAAWETLRGWVAGDPQPTALFLQFMCLALEPTFGGPCRFNPFFQIPDMDGRVRPRNPGNQVRAQSARIAPAPSSPAKEAPAPAVQPEAPSMPEAMALSPGEIRDSDLAVLREGRFDRREK